MGGLEGYLEYAAALRPIFPSPTDNKTAAAEIPPELFYAVLSVLNFSMLKDRKLSNEIMPSDRFSISPAHFLARTRTSRRVIATEKQFLGALKKLEKLNYLTSTRISPRQVVYHVTQKFEKTLRDHASIVWSFMTKGSPDELSALPFVDLLQLNEEIFNEFFYGNFGVRWRAIRARINERLSDSTRAASAVEKRDYHHDHIHENINIWAVFNLVVVAGEISFLNISAAAKSLQLHDYVTEEKNLQAAAKRLMDINYLKEHPKRMLRFHNDVDNEISLFRKDIVEGLSAVRDACSAFRFVAP